MYIKSTASFITHLSNITYYTNIPTYVLAFMLHSTGAGSTVLVLPPFSLPPWPALNDLPTNTVWSLQKLWSLLWGTQACITIAPGSSIMSQHYNILKYIHVHICTHAVDIPSAHVISYHPPCIMQHVQLMSIHQGNPSCPPQTYPPSNKGLRRPY